MENVLKTAREAIGLTQEQFAETFGVSCTDVEKYESGSLDIDGSAREKLSKIENDCRFEILIQMTKCEPITSGDRFKTIMIGRVTFFKTPKNERFGERVKKIGAVLLSPAKNIYSINSETSDKMEQVRQIMREEYGYDDIL